MEIYLQNAWQMYFCGQRNMRKAGIKAMYGGFMC